MAGVQGGMDAQQMVDMINRLTGEVATFRQEITTMKTQINMQGNVANNTSDSNNKKNLKDIMGLAQ